MLRPLLKEKARKGKERKDQVELLVPKLQHSNKLWQKEEQLKSRQKRTVLPLKTLRLLKRND